MKTEAIHHMYDADLPQQVCLRNVFHCQVGKMASFHPLPSFKDYNSQVSPFALDDLQAVLGSSFGEYQTLIQNTHRSIPTVDTLYQGMKKYINETTSDKFQSETTKNAYYQIALREIEKRFFGKEERMTPLDVTEVRNNILPYLSEPTASPGYPFIESGIHEKKVAAASEQYKTDIDEMCAYLQSVNNRDELGYRAYTYPCVAFQKTSVIKPGKDEKIRFIWGYPLMMVALEAMFAVPLIELAKKREDKDWTTPTSFRMTAYSGVYEDFVERYPIEGASVTDYSAYDTTVPAWLLEDVFAMIKKHYVMTDLEEKIFNIVVHYFIHTPMLFKETGTLFCKHHGIPSGSWFTNIVGSLANAIMMMTANVRFRTMPTIMKVMGDDNLCINGYNDFEELAPYLKSMFSVNVNVSKCYAGYLLGAKYLGRKFSSSTRKAFKGWVKSPADSILSLAFPARVDDANAYYQRLYSIYLDNPIKLLWRLVLKHEDNILEALKVDFDTNTNREIVFTMFNGDYDKARMFFSERSACLLSPLELARKF